MMRLGAAVLVMILGACAAPAPAPTSADGTDQADGSTPLQNVVADVPFELAIRAERGRYAPGQPIEVSATLRHIADAPAVFGGAAGGLVVFSVRNADGRIDTEWAMDAACERYLLEPNEAIDVPFQKSGGVGEADADAAFLREYFSDPLLRLPDGRWIVTAHAIIAEGDCRGRTWALDAPVEITVAP